MGQLRFVPPMMQRFKGRAPPRAAQHLPTRWQGLLKTTWAAQGIDLSVARKRSIRGELDWLRGIAGAAKFRVFKTYHVEKLMAKKSGPTAANTVKKNLSISQFRNQDGNGHHVQPRPIC